MTPRLATQRLPTRRLRGILAALMSLALVLSLFHCCCVDADADAGVSVVSVAQAGCDLAGKPAPAAPSAHCCHCLAHATTIAPQGSAVAIEYVAGAYRLAAASAPDAADPVSPFKPPRA